MKTPQSQRPMTSSAFSAFAGTSSAFSTASPSKGSALKPAWSAPDALRNLNNEPEVVESDEQNGASSHVLVAAATSNTTTVERAYTVSLNVTAVSIRLTTLLIDLTGEENEDVRLELKGVKMFMKRGDKPFSDSMVGHIKVLSDKTTQSERLLFRREPLWQVSLNLRLHPSVRCVYDANENVLRIILTEPTEKQEKREVVIYAFKPGRSCSRQDFKEFAEAFVKSPGLTAKADS
ncbi:hypothetical protein H0H92_000589 [Tricholoma furcatifolium]|nr:hypothetical protein H0H92_000589 [Tricholoma furcatifolium]